MKHRLISWLGWYGVCAILCAYTLVSFRIIDANGYSYQLLNLSGAAGIFIETSYKKDRQPAVLNAIWIIIAMIAILQLLFN
ncbi:hypothetical protein KC878_03045 [Candidatus Saccharibacteria bacterium]|nr:hypothetical protein [Candidatus Saccharibacteria bacterium]MCB9820943.1 hypothetical protein [Candidatus Nomurabacteria bacterium]